MFYAFVPIFLLFSRISYSHLNSSSNTIKKEFVTPLAFNKSVCRKMCITVVVILSRRQVSGKSGAKLVAPSLCKSIAPASFVYFRAFQRREGATHRLCPPFGRQSPTAVLSRALFFVGILSDHSHHPLTFLQQSPSDHASVSPDEAPSPVLVRTTAFAPHRPQRSLSFPSRSNTYASCN